MCAALSTIITGNRNQGWAFEEKIQELRLRGKNRHLYHLPGRDILSQGKTNMHYVTSTDLQLLAREIEINIYLHFDGDENEQSHWVVHTGNHEGATRGGIYLKAKFLITLSMSEISIYFHFQLRLKYRSLKIFRFLKNSR